MTNTNNFELETAELHLKADKFDKVVQEKEKLKEEKEVVEEVKQPKKVKKIIKKVIEQSESEEEVIEEVIIKKSNNNNKLTNHEKIKLAEQSAEDRLKQSLKEDCIQYLLSQLSNKL